MKNLLKNRKRSAFTLVEIMIVVLIIGILLAIAIPNFVRAREASRSKACIANLKQIDAAKEQYAMDNKLNTNSTAVASDPLTLTGSNLVGSSNYIKNAVNCPSNGTYTPGNIGTPPLCSISTNAAATYAPHVLP